MKAEISKAVEILRKGGLVAFPTETVYGLGADARSPDAVASIFVAKGRPSDRPLTVHVGSVDQAKDWAVWGSDADRLARAFWPGPLTLVLPRRDHVPDIVTAGQETVGVRMPDQAVAIELLLAFGSGVAAPSANRSGRISPTSAEHVRADLGDRIDFILDDGPCTLGIESTVLSLVEGVRVLRQGALEVADIEAVLGRPLDSKATATLSRYQVDTPLRLMSREMIRDAVNQNIQGRVLVLLGSEAERFETSVRTHTLPKDPLGFGKELFALLRELDAGGYSEILVERVPDEPSWAAIAQRLAATAGESA